jgi:hypothetical protein
VKALRVGFATLGAALLVLFVGGTTQAFHSGGTAECGGCHSMHSPKPGGSYLLIAGTSSSTCLSCHMHEGDVGPSSYHVATADSDMSVGVPPLQRGPAGDFGWLKKSYTMTVRGTTSTEPGDHHGHNIVATDLQFNPDPENATAPGGTFPSTLLGCASCHDPHSRIKRIAGNNYVTGGNYTILGSGSYSTSPTPAAGEAVGNYRLLRGLGDTHVGGATFPGVAIAIAPASYNRTESATQTRVAYGASGTNTWGNWCASCHPDMHSSGSMVHPIDQSLTSTVANIYNAYKMSGDLTGVAASSFSSLVPFAEDTGDIATLQGHAKSDDTYLNGPGNSDKVICLSCHRAHASGWPEALRWNMEGEFIIYNSLFPGTDTTPTVPQFARGRLGAETQAAYYDRPVTKFASYQRVLCNKCHAKD